MSKTLEQFLGALYIKLSEDMGILHLTYQVGDEW